MATDQMSGRGTAAPEDGDSGMVSQVQQQVQEKAKDVKGQAAEKVREQLDSRSTDFGDQVQSLAQALRRSAEQLDQDGKSGPAGIARQAAGHADRLGSYLKSSSSDRFLDDVESFARNRPWAAGGIGALVGLAASRFLKASSGERYARSSSGQDLDAPLSRDSAPYSPAAAPTTSPQLERGRA
jgi:ElaB/YqjD/DUF883 family membrane-anchored ribosome-binding protein